MAAVCLAAACQPRALTQEQLLVSKDTASDQGSVVSADAGSELPADGQVAPDGDTTAGGDTSPAVDAAAEVDTAAEVVDAAAEVDAAAPCPASCDDGNPCTTDLCDNTAGCTSTPNAKTCDDGQVCTTGDVCTGGQCKGKPKVWQAVLGSKHTDHGNAVVGHSDGSVTAAGRHAGNVEDDFWLARFGSDGALVWHKQYGEPDVVESAYGLAAMANGLLARFDPLGNFVWKKVMGGAGADGLAAIAALPNGFALVGDTPKAGGNAGMWVVRTDAWGHGDCASASLCKAPCASSSACKIAWCELGNCLGASVPDGGWCMESPCLAGTCDAKKSCGSVVAVSCDDGNPCTTYGCSSSGGCSHAQTSDGTPCASGSVCKAGACVAGQ